MSRRTGFSIPLQVLLWALGNTAAGLGIGVAVSVLQGGGIEGPLLLIGVLFGNVVGFTVLTASLVLSPRLRGMTPVATWLLLGLVLISGSTAGTALVLYLFPFFVLRDVRQAFAVCAINGVLALIVGSVVHAYEGLRWRLAESLREVEEVRLVEAHLRENAARAELAALQARINPHFFFNTLNTISSLLAEDPSKADDVVQTLADLFRYTFKATHSGPVTLQEELDFIEGYLAIERARFGDRLRVVWDIDPGARAIPVPGLILQPLVENAVGHGIAPVSGGGTVTITARVGKGELAIEVSDDGAGLRSAPEALIEDGHGLSNVRGRLATLYGAEGRMELVPAQRASGAVARLRLPCPEPPAGQAVVADEVVRFPVEARKTS
jgi:two-component sensor histidine kinase